MPPPQIKQVIVAGRTELWYYMPSEGLNVTDAGKATELISAEQDSFIGQIYPGENLRDVAFGQYRDKPPGTAKEQGHWYKPRIPIGQQQQYPAMGAFPDNDTARRDAYRTWGEKQGPLSGMPDVEARMVMARFVENYEGKPGGYTLVPQPGGLVNIGLPDKLPPGLTAEQQVLFEQKKELGQLQIDAAKRAADLEIAGGITAAGFRPGATINEQDVPTDPENVVRAEGGFFYKTGPDSWTFRESPQQAPYQDAVTQLDGGAGGQMVQTSPTGFQFQETPEYAYQMRRAQLPGAPTITETPFGVYQAPEETGVYEPLAMGESPGQVEFHMGAAYLRDTRGNLTPLNNVLDRMKEQMFVDGRFDDAMLIDDFQNRPSPQEHIQTMMDWARRPADQAMMSAIARGYTSLPPGVSGQINRVAPVSPEEQAAWNRYEQSVTGAPSVDDLQQLIQSEADETRKRELEQQQRFVDQANDYRKQIEEQQKNTWGQVEGRMESMAEAFASSVKDLGSALGIPRPEAEKQYPGGKAPWTAADTAAGFAAGTGSIRDLILGAGSDIYQAGEASFVLDQAINDAVSEMARRGIEPGNPRFPSEITTYMKGLISQGIIQFDRQPSKAWTAKQPKDKPKVYTAKDGTEFKSQAEATAHDTAEAAAEVSPVAPVALVSPDEPTVYEDVTGITGFDPSGARRGLGQTIAPDTRSYETVDELFAAVEELEKAQAPQDVAIDPEDYDLYEPAAPSQTYGEYDPSEWAGGFYGEEDYAGGGKVFRDTLAMVGEEGPELVKLPQGARVIPADATQEMMRGRRPIPMQAGGEATGQGLVFGPEERERARTLGWGDVTAVGGEGGYLTTTEGLAALRAGARREEIPTYTRELGFSEAQMKAGVSYPTPAQLPGGGQQLGSWEGGLPVAAPSNIPERLGPISNVAGVQEVLSGRQVRPLTGRLMRAANINVPSAQAWRNLSPEEREIYMDLVARSGIGPGYAQRAIQGAQPASAARAGTARVLPLAARRY